MCIRDSSYTAVPYTQEIPDGDTNDDTQGKGDSGNTSGGTSNDSTQSGESTGNLSLIHI